MSVPIPRTCEECGSDTYFAQEFASMRDRLYRVMDQYRRQALQHAAAKAQWELRIYELEERAKSTQAKAHRQRLALNRLEAKLRARGERPYAKAPEVSEP